MNLKRGQREKLEKFVSLDSVIDIEMGISGSDTYDFCCFGVDANDRLADDRYMIFYNQTVSPKKEIIYSGSENSAKFRVNLADIPVSISKLVFTASIDGSTTMGNINFHAFSISQNGTTALELNMNGTDFSQEKAIITVEIYRKDVWRINAVARGFDGGLGDLLRSYGGEEETAPSPKVSLEKKLEQAPQLVSLAKPLKVELEKRNLLDVTAKVALVMDISGSMDRRYKDGTVQEIINKILPIAVQFDDDGELDFWYYGTSPKRMPSVNLRNYTSAVPADWRNLRKNIGGSNNEVAVMCEVCEEYENTQIPVYVIFITDGGVANANKIKKTLQKASEMPIFWQYVGVGGRDYGILEKLDTMEGRYVDNANFFALDDFKTVRNSELYSRLLNEFPQWLREIKLKNMI